MIEPIRLTKVCGIVYADFIGKSGLSTTMYTKIRLINELEKFGLNQEQINRIIELVYDFHFDLEKENNID